MTRLSLLLPLLLVILPLLVVVSSSSSRTYTTKVKRAEVGGKLLGKRRRILVSEK